MSAPALADFNRTTARWGSATMTVALALTLAGPLWFMFGTGHWPGFGPVSQAWLSVAAVFGVLWIAEPVTYYPMLGPAAMYQAFMIGNIANKILPSAVAAQNAVGARQGTAKAELAAVTAIVGAAVVHLLSLLVFVGLLGSWIVAVLPASVRAVFDYVVPAIFGPVLVQAILTAKRFRVVAIALGCGIAGVFVIVPLLPGAETYAMALCVLAAIGLSVLTRERGRSSVDEEKQEVSL
ncbi:hypothetical protein GCM10027174_42500 [Salinifilum aidingensis]